MTLSAEEVFEESVLKNERELLMWFVTLQESTKQQIYDTFSNNLDAGEELKRLRLEVIQKLLNKEVYANKSSIIYRYQCASVTKYFKLIPYTRSARLDI